MTILLILGILVYLIIGIVIVTLLDQIGSLNVEHELPLVICSTLFPVVVIWILLRSTAYSIVKKILGKGWEF